MADKGGSSRRLSFIDDQSQPDTQAPVQQATQGRERRKSIWNQAARKSLFPGGAGARRLSQSFSHGSRKSSQELPRLKFANTYRTEPNENERFQPYKVEPKIYDLLETELSDEKYDPVKSAAMSKELSQDVMRETRLLVNSSRYKLVTHVVIGEIQGQDIRFGSRCLWDQKLDNVCSVTYKNHSLYATATVFAVYFEWIEKKPVQLSILKKKTIFTFFECIHFIF